MSLQLLVMFPLFGCEGMERESFVMKLLPGIECINEMFTLPSWLMQAILFVFPIWFAIVPMRFATICQFPLDTVSYGQCDSLSW
jgi:hypothetical protein